MKLHKLKIQKVISNESWVRYYLSDTVRVSRSLWHQLHSISPSYVFCNENLQIENQYEISNFLTTFKNLP